MPESFDGQVTIAASPDGPATITLSGNGADVKVGGSGQHGDGVFHNADGREVVRIGPVYPPAPPPGDHPTPVPKNLHGSVRVNNNAAVTTVRLDGGKGEVAAGDGTRDRVILNATTGDDIRILDAKGRKVFAVDGQIFGDAGAGVLVGGAGKDKGKPGWVAVRNKDGLETVLLNGGNDFDILVRDPDGRNAVVVDARAVGNTVAGLFVGSFGEKDRGRPGWVAVRNKNGRDTVMLNGGDNFDILVRDPEDRDVLLVNVQTPDGPAALVIGGGGDKSRPGAVFVKDKSGKDSIVLDGLSGDILLNNADFAEDFDVVGADIRPGSVMVIDDAGALRASTVSYDRRVAGVVSGAGSYKPAIVLDRQTGRPGRRPVALTGKVFCLADAGCGAIGIGDLLTTSDTSGHAMRAEPARAPGAVLGKALGRLDAGTGLIPILVTLQ